jgi:pSer/pThr/pTyr-binding forkhead associated (FHA) protein
VWRAKVARPGRQPGGEMRDASRPATAAEVQALLNAERTGEPFVLFRDGGGSQVIRTLGPEQILTVGRHSSCDIALAWDHRVSRTHAVLERLGSSWTLADDGISRNGTFLNGMRLASRRRLVDRDVVRLGATTVTFRHPGDADVGTTDLDDSMAAAELTAMQRKVLIELCRPFKAGSPYAAPATNAQIAQELVLSIDAVKTHMRGLFERFRVGDLPQNRKRARVAERALQTGIVTRRDL